MKRILLMFSVSLLLSGCVPIEATPPQPKVYHGVVQEKYFSKGDVTTGVGFGLNGKQTIVTTATSDEYIIFVNNEDYSVSKEDWLRLEKGQTILYEKGFSTIKIIEVEDVKNTSDQ